LGWAGSGSAAWIWEDICGAQTSKTGRATAVPLPWGAWPGAFYGIPAKVSLEFVHRASYWARLRLSL
jgi:hypothetical protein